MLVSLIATSYPAELLGRPDRFAVTVLAAAQRALAGRFAASGRPGARLLLDGVPHRRGALSGALIPDGGLAALECEVTRRVDAGDHLLVIARVAGRPVPGRERRTADQVPRQVPVAACGEVARLSPPTVFCPPTTPWPPSQNPATSGTPGR